MNIEPYRSSIKLCFSITLNFSQLTYQQHRTSHVFVGIPFAGYCCSPSSHHDDQRRHHSMEYEVRYCPLPTPPPQHDQQQHVSADHANRGEQSRLRQPKMGGGWHDVQSGADLYVSLVYGGTDRTRRHGGNLMES
jgi:hypothetical protein